MTSYDPEDPRILRFHQQRLVQRDVDQMLAVCEFTLQDGHISQDEAEAILTWLNSRRSTLDIWRVSGFSG